MYYDKATNAILFGVVVLKNERQRMWRAAAGSDIGPLTDISEQQIAKEVDGMFVIDPIEFSRQVGQAIINQFYNPYLDLLWVYEQDSKIVAYCWAKRGEQAPWSRDEMVAVRLVHLEETLPRRQRLKLLTEMIEIWENWARSCGVGIVCSSSMRREYAGYMAVHQRCGYDVRGSIAYKRMLYV
jgi:hypothetical protein